MKSTEQLVKELLEHFLHQNIVRKTEANNGKILVYKVGDELVRVDIKVNRKEKKNE